MHFGTKLAAILKGSLLAAAVGCADAANVTGNQTAPDAPEYDGSAWTRSGNRTESDSITTPAVNGIGSAGSGNLTDGNPATTKPTGLTTEAVTCSSEERGGGWIGPGGRGADEPCDETLSFGVGWVGSGN